MSDICADLVEDCERALVDRNSFRRGLCVPLRSDIFLNFQVYKPSGGGQDRLHSIQLGPIRCTHKLKMAVEPSNVASPLAFTGFHPIKP
jgi:hypothetical protein